MVSQEMPLCPIVLIHLMHTVFMSLDLTNTVKHLI